LCPARGADGRELVGPLISDLTPVVDPVAGLPPSLEQMPTLLPPPPPGARPTPDPTPLPGAGAGTGLDMDFTRTGKIWERPMVSGESTGSTPCTGGRRNTTQGPPPRGRGSESASQGHDLRRTFGRVAYEANVSLAGLSYLYGYESADRTARYIGLDDAAARKGLESFDEAMRALDSTSAGAGA
jgi:hypothetical protein